MSLTLKFQNLKTLLLILSVSLSNLISAQTNLNDYKYIIVPKHFDAFKKENQHQTSTLVKYLFSEKGFNAVYDDALPPDLNTNRCLALLASPSDDSSMFTTKTTITLKDCNGAEVFTTREGKSKSKEFKKAFNESIRKAMESFNGVNYVYSGKDVAEEKPLTVSFKNDVKSLKNTRIAEKLEPKGMNTDKVKYKKAKNDNPMVIQEATTENQSYKNLEPEASNMGEKVDDDNLNVEIWYAQEIPNGYQLVDSTPKIRMKLFKSSNDHMYMAQSDGKSGVVYEKDGKWIFEYYEGGNLVQESLNIKF